MAYSVTSFELPVGWQLGHLLFAYVYGEREL